MKTFKQALEKRVSCGVKADKHTVFFVAKKIIGNMFGAAGTNNVKISDWVNGNLVLVCEKSIWRSELILNKSQLIELINGECNGGMVSDIKVRQFYVGKD
jgi:hypothetical protein